VRPLRSYRLSALVLRSRNLGEADRLLTLLSAEKGKITAVAKGARKPRSKLASLQLFTLATLQLATGKNLDVITQAQIRLSFPTLRAEIPRFTYAGYFTELADAFSETEQKNRHLFDLTVAAIALLERGIDPEKLAREFELKLLDLSGYAPEIEVCVRCAQPIDSPAMHFSPALGGIICQACSREIGGLPLLHKETRDHLQAIRKRRGLSLSKGEMLSERGRRELQYFLRSQIEYHLERKPKSLKLLDKLLSEKKYDQR
jgi:DNA repair protein RecO (recombination protein O)